MNSIDLTHFQIVAGGVAAPSLTPVMWYDAKSISGFRPLPSEPIMCPGPEPISSESL